MTTRAPTRGTGGLDRSIEAAHAAVLERLAPGTSSRRLRWSQGETRVLELGDGPPLVLVHGAFDNAALWAPILAALATHRRVLAVDLPGHGLADPFDHEAADLATLSATFLGDVLDGLALDRVDLVGCSLGRLRPDLCLGERWQALGVPTVFLRGEHDVFVSRPVKEAWAAIVARNRDIRIVSVADAGHLAWRDAPVEVVRGIEGALAEDVLLPV